MPSPPPARRRPSLRLQCVLGVALVQAALMTAFVLDLLTRQRALAHGDQSLPDLMTRAALYALASLVAGAALSWWLINLMTKRMAALQDSNARLEARVATHSDELAASEAALRAILEHANDAFIQMDQQGRVTGWNEMAQTTFGWAAAEAIGKPLADLIVPAAQREAHAKGLARYLATGKPGVLANQRAELTGCTRDGREIQVEVSLRTRRRGELSFFDAFLRDITERKRLEHTLEQQAATDALTGLPNRRSLLQTLPMAMRRSQRTGRPLALIFLDLDGFKNVNDSYGHEAGDLVLIEFARRLLASVRETDAVARLGGDEFVVIIENLVSGGDDAGRVADKILSASLVPYELGGHAIPLSASVGVSLYTPEDDITAQDLLARSDEAMYRSKHRGKARVSVWADL